MTLTRAGIAYKVVAQLAAGSRINGCLRDRHGTYTCTVDLLGRREAGLLEPVPQGHGARGQVGPFAHGVSGYERTVSGGAPIGVGMSPIMVRSIK